MILGRLASLARDAVLGRGAGPRELPLEIQSSMTIAPSLIATCQVSHGLTCHVAFREPERSAIATRTALTLASTAQPTIAVDVA